MVYKRYILPIGGLHATYHLLGEPKTTIDIYLHLLIIAPTKAFGWWESSQSSVNFSNDHELHWKTSRRESCYPKQPLFNGCFNWMMNQTFTWEMVVSKIPSISKLVVLEDGHLWNVDSCPFRYFQCTSSSYIIFWSKEWSFSKRIFEWSLIFRWFVCFFLQVMRLLNCMAMRGNCSQPSPSVHEIRQIPADSECWLCFSSWIPWHILSWESKGQGHPPQ